MKRDRMVSTGALFPLRESEVAAQVRAYYRRLGCTVIPFSDKRRGRKAVEGVPDLYVMPTVGRAFWHEVKSSSGKLSAAQQEFIAACRRCGTDVVVGGLEEAVTYWSQRQVAA